MTPYQKPNVLIIMPDQMRGDCLGLEAHPALLTPNIDELGAHGAHFTQAYTTCASCIPARRAMLTGLFPSHNGMVGYQEGAPFETPTFPQLFQQDGYHTAIVGRYMHQSPYEKSYGFDERILGSSYIEGDDYARMLDEAEPLLGGIRGLGISFNGWQAKTWTLPEHLHPTNWTARRSRQLLETYSSDAPLMLINSYIAPHPPLIPPSFYMERYLRMSLPEPAIGDWAVLPDDAVIGQGVDSHRVHLQGEALRSAQAGYYGLINQLDDQLYWVITTFREMSQQMGRPWVIVFTSDHGEMLGDHYYFRKCEPYDGASRIPFLIQGSPELGLISGLKNDQPVCLEDIMPTLLELCGIPAPQNLDGRSLIPLLRGENQETHKYIHGEHAPCYSQEQAYHFLTDGRMKYIWRPLNGEEQLFDLKSDNGELHDLRHENHRSEDLSWWRALMVRELQGRPEGFTDGIHLLPGKPYDSVLPQAAT